MTKHMSVISGRLQMVVRVMHLRRCTDGRVLVTMRERKSGKPRRLRDLPLFEACQAGWKPGCARCQTARTSAACGPFGPWVTLYSTFWFSSSVL
jgi:hypothetical protein